MAFADFFSRNYASAAILLQNYGEEAFNKKLQDQLIAVAFDAHAARSSGGRASLDLTIRLMARLYPRISIVPLDEWARQYASTVRQLAQAINPKIEITRGARAATACLVVGRTSIEGLRARTIYIGSDGWIARISRSTPQKCDTSRNPFGAGVASCIAAANLFRDIFSDQLVSAEPDTELEISALELNAKAQTLFNPRLTAIDVGTVHVAGLGAVGNGVIWALANSKIKGRFFLIDPQTVELSNLQRYVLTSRLDDGAAKTEVATRYFATGTRKVQRIDLSWEGYVTRQTEWKFDQVLVALDTPEDRISLQASLPKTIINGWTQRGESGVSRHRFTDDFACLACLYIPRGLPQSEDAIIATALRIPQFLIDVRRRLDTAVPNDQAFLAVVAKALNISEDRLAPFVGKPLRSLYVEGICGGTILQFLNQAGMSQIDVPMAFQSALTGILMAAELVGRHLPNRPDTPNITQIDLLRSFPEFPSHFRRKSDSPPCMCQDEDYIATYLAKYPD